MHEPINQFDADNPSGIDVGMSLTLGLVIVILTAVTVFASWAWFNKKAEESVATMQHGEIAAEHRAYQEAQGVLMTRKGWHPSKKTASVPIDQAIAIMKIKYKSDDCPCPDKKKP